MTDEDWNSLIRAIDRGKCTPFLGAGASAPLLELGGDIARRWAVEEGYPFGDRSDLGQVAQYMALNLRATFPDHERPKQKMVDELGTRSYPPGLEVPKRPDLFGTLAELRKLPVYITTNYDAFLTEALQARDRNVKREFCRWNGRLEQRFPPDTTFVAKPETPMVFHLHGHDGVVESLVLTEDDYVDFIVNVSQRPELIPTMVQDAMTDNTLLFLGYSLRDWNFKVLFRTMQNYLVERSTQRGHVAVQLRPDDAALDRKTAERYIERYFQEMRIGIFWGTCQEFNDKLRHLRGM